MDNVILQWALSLAASLITLTFTGVVIPLLVKYFNAKISNEKYQRVVTELGNSVSDSVGYVMQTMVSTAKREGKWDADAQKQALTTAVSEVLCDLPDETRKILNRSDVDLRHLVERKVEAKIAELKQCEATVAYVPVSASHNGEDPIVKIK